MSGRNILRSGADRIAAERARQIAKEGWTPEHDDEHVTDELAWAAVCYAAPTQVFRRTDWCDTTTGRGSLNFADPWPDDWSSHWDKRPRRRRPTRRQRIRMLEKAGALIAAEIDRLLRRRS